MLSDFFAADSKVMLFISKFFDVLILSLLFLVCCLPVVTIGPALCALYHCTKKAVIEREGYLVREFFHSFRVNFLQGLLIWLGMLVVCAFMIVNIFYTATNWKGAFGISMSAIYFAILCIDFIIMGYLFPMLSRFQCKTKVLLSNTISLAVTYPIQTILLLLLQIVFYFLLCYSFACIPILLFFIPVGFSALQGCILEKIFAKYMEADNG